MKVRSLFILMIFSSVILAGAQEPKICKPQKENEVRVFSQNFGNGPVLFIRTPKLQEVLMYDKDCKTLLTRMLECVLTDSEQERITQEITIDYGVVSCCRIERIDKTTNLISNSIYSPSGKLLYSYDSKSGKSYYDAEGQPIDEARANQIFEAHRSEGIDIAKILQPSK